MEKLDEQDMLGVADMPTLSFGFKGGVGEIYPQTEKVNTNLDNFIVKLASNTILTFKPGQEGNKCQKWEKRKLNILIAPSCK